LLKQRREVVDENLVVRELVIHLIEKRVRQLVTKHLLKLCLNRVVQQLDPQLVG